MSSPATAAGYTILLAWMCGYGRLGLVGVEGAGVYGVGLARLVRDEWVTVIEVDRLDRKTRRLQGKSDPIDAIQAAKAAWPQNVPAPASSATAGSRPYATSRSPGAVPSSSVPAPHARGRP